MPWECWGERSTTAGPFSFPLAPSGSPRAGITLLHHHQGSAPLPPPTESSPLPTALAAPGRSSSLQPRVSSTRRESQLISRLLTAQQSIQTSTRLCSLSHETLIPLISRWEGISLLCQTIKEMKKHPPTTPPSVLTVARYLKEDFFPP